MPSPLHASPRQCLSTHFRAKPSLCPSMPSLCWSMPPRCHSALSPYTATLCLCHSMFCPLPALRRCTYPRLRVSSQHCTVPELRKTKPLRGHALPLRGSSSLRCTHALLCIAPARLLSAQPRPCIDFPSRGYTKPKLVTALPIYAKALDSLSLRVNASALPVNAFRSNA